MNYCFGDFEFTCGRKRDHETRELLSAGLVFYDANFNELHRYYKTAKPVAVKKLTKFCKELTGLTQEEINASEDSSIIYTDMLELFAKYQIDTIYTMGNCDAPDLRKDAEVHRREGVEQQHCGDEIADLILNIQDALLVFSKIKTKESIGIQKFLDFYHIEIDGPLHNSFVDAYALSKIYEKLIYKREATKTPEILEYEAMVAEREARIQAERARRLAEKKALEEQQSNHKYAKK